MTKKSVVLLAMIYCTAIFAEERVLKKQTLEIDGNAKESFLKIATSLILKDKTLFVLDNLGSNIKLFRINENRIIYLKSIGVVGKGPGDIYLPISFSIDKDKIAIADNESISIFTLDGTFRSKFRIFSQTISIAYSKNCIYQLTANPNLKNLILVYSENGARKGDIYSKYLPVDISKSTDINLTTWESFFYRGRIFAEEGKVYYLNVMLGTLSKLDRSGKTVSSISLAPALDRRSATHIKENHEMLHDGIKAEYPKGGGRLITVKTICQDAYIFKGMLYLIGQDVESDSVYLRSFNLLSMKPNNVYRFTIGSEDRIRSFAVGEDSGGIYFIIALDTDEGLGFVKCFGEKSE